MTAEHRVAIVVVSHSRALAHAAVGLATQMLHGEPVVIAVAAGLDDGSLGTSAQQIGEALEQVDGPAGVVVLMDLGSAVLSTEIALELLPDPSARDRVVLSPAPLVEGLVLAVVAAAGGADRHAVAAEAAGALLAKSTHLGSPDTGDLSSARDAAQTTSGPPPATTALPGEMAAAGSEVTAAFTVHNQHGLHARPAARLVATVNALDASVQLRNVTSGVGPVPAGSLSRVATLAALHGHSIEIRATGAQAQQVVEQVLALADRRFDETGPTDDALRRADPDTSHPDTSHPDTSGRDTSGRDISDRDTSAAVPASAGIAVGGAHLFADPLQPDGVAGTETDPDGTISPLRRIVEAVADVRRDIEQLRWRTLQDLGAEEASIFDAHLALLADPEMMAGVEARLGDGAGAVPAWTATLQQVAQQWARLPDPYLSARAADVHAVAAQVVRALRGPLLPTTSGQGVLVARDLGPAETIGLASDLVKGVVLAQGSASSHAAILARARGIPMVVAAGDHVLSLPTGTPVALDGSTGELHIDPSAEVLADFEGRARALGERRARDLAAALAPAVTLDGHVVQVAANVGSVADAGAATAGGAHGAGLVRTEFLFLGRGAAPSMQEQEREYCAIAEAMPGHRITLRTLDVGGDKPLPYETVPTEQNPFLGLRGIRLTLDRPALLTEQLEAICRTGRRFPVSVMFPMVSTVDELLAARHALVEAAGLPGLPDQMRVGMMVEVPAAALKIKQFLPHLDFVSIGTNDLTQYTLAAERGNPSVAALSDSLDPAVLHLIAHVCRAAQGRADVAVCGEAASDETAVPILVGLGVRELSVTPPAVPAVKAALRRLDAGRCRELAEQALTLDGPQDVRALVRSALAAG